LASATSPKFFLSTNKAFAWLERQVRAALVARRKVNVTVQLVEVAFKRRIEREIVPRAQPQRPQIKCQRKSLPMCAMCENPVENFDP
jgi:hypothetical protein